MFHDLGAGHEVILLCKHGVIRKKQRIINGHALMALFQHLRQRRTRAAAEIQSFRSWFEPLAQGGGQAIEECPVAWIVWIVLVQIIMSTFGSRSGQLVRMNKCQLTARAAEIVAAISMGESLAMMILAERAAHGRMVPEESSHRF